MLARGCRVVLGPRAWSLELQLASTAGSGSRQGVCLGRAPAAVAAAVFWQLTGIRGCGVLHRSCTGARGAVGLLHARSLFGPPLKT